MKFRRFKIKRCKNCKYYCEIGNMHACTRWGYKKCGVNNIIAPLKLICLGKKVNKDE